ncbi:MAG: winged helix-turn-helix transcriptional regulator [Kineosporiaceae bacterium]
MGAPYRQFCPVAKAMELLDERWTLLVVRELIAGSRHFNELRRGNPRMSPSLLSRRLQQLTRAGIVERVEGDGEVSYLLTEAGHELRPVVEALGAWGVRWIGTLGEADLDPKLLLWDMHRHLAADAIPDGRTVVRFRFDDVPTPLRDWWLVIADGEADVCDVDPGHPVAVTVTAGLRSMVAVWMGDLTWARAIRSGAVGIDGPARLRRRLPDWFTLSDFAAVPRRTPELVTPDGADPVAPEPLATR